MCSMSRPLLIAAAALLFSACASGFAKQVATDAEVKRKLATNEGSPDKNAKFTCETETLVGSHLPQTYCYYKDANAEDQERIRVQTNRDFSAGNKGCTAVRNGTCIEKRTNAPQ